MSILYEFDKIYGSRHFVYVFHELSSEMNRCGSFKSSCFEKLRLATQSRLRFFFNIKSYLTFYRGEKDESNSLTFVPMKI